MKKEWNILRFIVTKLNRLTSFLKKNITVLNQNREGKYSANVIALGACLLSLMLLILMLFVPPVLGMSDDGSFSSRMNPAGIYHREDSSENLYFNYYVKDYLSLAAEGSTLANLTGQRILVFMAKWLDSFFTSDRTFDLRFLALLYGLLYIPAVFLLIKQGLQRVITFTESIVIGMTGIFIFADVSYLTYFSSFYTEPMVFISLLFCTGAALALQQKKRNLVYVILYSLFGVILTTIEVKYAVVGLILGILGVKFIFLNKNLLWKICCCTAVLALFLSVMFSLRYSPASFNESSKYHAMTRGVLLQSVDPEETLKEFGIDSSYSILTDTNSNDQYPLLRPDNKDLNHGFYDKYNSAEIAYYYLKHPGSLVAMLDISVKATFNIRRDMSGNYEKSAGMPKMAKSILWSFWSRFKADTIPKTIGFLVVLLAAVILLFRQKSSRLIRDYDPRGSIPMETMLAIFMIGISNAVITIVNSGDTEMVRHLFLFSVSLDILIYFILAELIHKLRIL